MKLNFKNCFILFLIFIVTFFMFIHISIHISNDEKFLENLYYIKESPIHGKGVFASVKLNKDSDLGVVIVKHKKNIKYFRLYDTDRFMKDHNGDIFKEHRSISRYINHSETPNTEIIINENTCRLRTINDIKEGEEITVNYKPFRDSYMNGFMDDINSSTDI